MEVHVATLRNYFLGNAQVQLQNMDFAPGVRDFDKANVDRLVNIFRLEGCQRDDPTHFVPGLIAREHLGPEWQQLLEPQRLSLPTSVVMRCLHGKHRILAAKEVLPPHEQWWNVALYDEGEFEVEYLLLED